MTVGQRIKKLRQALDLTQQEFADQLGVSRGNIGAYETGKSNIGPAAFSLICKTFHVSESWLRTGEGEMYAVRSREDELAAAVNNLLSEEKPEFRRRLILALAGLTDSQWDYLEDFLQGVLDEQSLPDEETPEERHERHKREARAEADELYEVILKEKMEQDYPETTFGSNSYGGGVA